MIASFTGTLRNGHRNALDAPVAALAGLSVAFVAFAAPADVLAELVGSTGISSLISAAEPPLGMKARFSLGAAGAVAVSAAVFLLLRWLDRLGQRGAKKESGPTDELEVPRLRRRDFHPDAAPRRPLLAGLELGEPVEVQTDPMEPLSLPNELSDEPACPDEPACAAQPVRNQTPEGIPELMERLEQGLARRRTQLEPIQITDPPVFDPNPAQDRLQSAIESLQRLTSRQN